MSRSSAVPAFRVALVAAGFLLTACSADAGGEPSTPTAVELAASAEDARTAAVAALAGLRDGPLVTRTTGSAGSAMFVADAAVDPRSSAMRLDETLNDIIRTEFVLVDGLLYARIYPTTDPAPAFTVSAPDAREQGFYDEALTGSGRVFGDVDTIAAVFERVPSTVYELGERPADGGTETGYRFVFDTYDIGSFLVAESLEASVAVPDPDTESTTFDVWLDPGLRELTTSGAVYQDGELIEDVELTIEFEPVDDATIAIPDDTLPR